MDAAQQKRTALDLLLLAWEEALKMGVEPEILASTALFAAFSDMVEAHGVDSVAAFCETLAPRVRNGEFTLRE
jgi:hypothetical protein